MITYEIPKDLWLWIDEPCGRRYKAKVVELDHDQHLARIQCEYGGDAWIPAHQVEDPRAAPFKRTIMLGAATVKWAIVNTNHLFSLQDLV